MSVTYKDEECVYCGYVKSPDCMCGFDEEDLADIEKELNYGDEE